MFFKRRHYGNAAQDPVLQENGSGTGRQNAMPAPILSGSPGHQETAQSPVSVTQQQMEEILSRLNEEQRRAAMTLNGPVLVLAGAGTGKTRVLTSRVANLLAHGVSPARILALTFTNKAANEMRTRIQALAEASEAWICTFHSAGAKILKRWCNEIGYRNDFTILSAQDTRSALIQICDQLNIPLGDGKILAQKYIPAISRAKNLCLTPEQWYLSADKTIENQTICKIYDAYEKMLRRINAFDFDDLLCKTVKLFREKPDVLALYQDQFQYILVDEYQDTNHAQYILISMLAEKHRNLFVVGDDDQAIYGWRGADIHNILNFEHDYKEALTIRLEQNYRCTKNILAAANSVIAHNQSRKEKSLWTDNAPGDAIVLYEAQRESDEAQWVAEKISSLRAHGVRLRDIAILYRANAQSRALEESLVKKGIAYQIFAGQRFYDRKEVRDLLAYLRLAVSPDDDLALCRILGLNGDQYRTLLSRASARDLSIYRMLKEQAQDEPAARILSVIQELQDESGRDPGELVELIAKKSGLLKDSPGAAESEVQNNLRQLISSAQEFSQDHPGAQLRDFLDQVALLSDLDSEKSIRSYVSLMTLHSAKGLEYKVVFLVGLSENVFPSFGAVKSGTVEEERRLAYVGFTRAKEMLFLSRSRAGMYNKVNLRSTFLDEISGARICTESTVT